MLKTICCAAACASLLIAADLGGAIYWSAEQLKGLEKTLAGKMDETKSGTEQLMNKGNHNALVFHREGSGLAAVQEKLADFVVMRSGKGAVLEGGKVVDGKPVGPGEICGRSVEDGTRYKLAPGEPK